ncbi:ornithine cyclodeaminase family protein [Ornithinimicrobium cerasi]|uniref:ornithine cyclodeaminase family protein n=1 Tax=Ornithinimicrobium cerasi TaxID=2248773 RepID=UPI00137AA34B|nr:ornithine cyclodeaminase family protein [Ornithinimicrobium cerasi]
MQMLDAARVRALLAPRDLVEALRVAFAAPDVTVPERSHHRLDDERDATLLLMPAWRTGRLLGVKIVTHHPRNGEHGRPAIHGTYVLGDAATGEPLAVLDGTELTRWRTAAASALAADHLAPEVVREHLLVGAGNVAAAVPHCYAAVRDVHLTRVWARSPARAASLVDRLRAGVRRADVITCATSATEPLVHGADVGPGTHVDLVGAFTPQMVEGDEQLVTSASLFVDVGAALHEPGDLVGPLGRGTLRPEDVLGDLADLAAGRHTGRAGPEEVTVFKSVGTALEDLVAATVVWEARTRAGDGGRG